MKKIKNKKMHTEYAINFSTPQKVDIGLRDYFASQALTYIGSIQYGDTGRFCNAFIAKKCYEIADAMIKERQRS